MADFSSANNSDSKREQENDLGGFCKFAVR